MKITKTEFLSTLTSEQLSRDMASHIIGSESHDVTQNDPINVDLTMGIQRILIHHIMNSHLKFLGDNFYPKLLDIGSAFEMITYFASFADVSYLEPRWQNGINLRLPGIGAMKSFCCEAQQLPFEDKTFDFITSLHAIEHFGLGRYGDRLDAQGDINGLKEMFRTLKTGCKLITSVPVASKMKLEWPGQRIYSPSHFNAITSLCGFKTEFQVVVYPPGHPENICYGAGTSDLEAWPTNWTPPILITVCVKE